MEYKDFSPDDFVNDGFFVRWVKGDEESRWFWESFLKQHPEKADAVKLAREVVLALDFQPKKLPAQISSDMRSKLILTLKASREREQEQVKHFSIETFRRNTVAWSIAASLLLTASIMFTLITRSEKKDIIAQLQSMEDTQTRSVPRGEKSVINLADGTKVWLNADSKLTYGNDFGSQMTRDVYLEGEAFFEVAHNEAKPFIVHTSDLNIKVLGTSFNVKSYGDERRIETTLVEGKVRINRTGEFGDEASLILKPNQKAVFEKETKMMDVEQVQAEHTTAWRQDILVFDEAPYTEVLLELERWYDVKIYMDSGTDPGCKLTANIEKESLEDVLNMLTTSNKVSYTISGKEVYIKGTLCN